MATDPTFSVRDHWETVWQTKATDEVSWFQHSPEP